MRKPYWFLSIPMIVYACGVDDGRGGQVSTGLPTARQLSTLEAHDLGTVCSAYADAFAAIAQLHRDRLACGFLAAALIADDAEGPFDVSACDMATQRCLNGELMIELGTPETLRVDCSDAFLAKLGVCSATVGEFEACATQTIGVATERRRNLACETTGAALNHTPEPLPACEDFNSKCGNMVDSMSP